MSLWNGIQRVGSCQIYKRKRVWAFIIDETIIQIGNQHFWLWFCIEPIHSSLLGIFISEQRNRTVAEKFIRSLVKKYGKHIVFTDGGTWYNEACNVIRLKHYLHSRFWEKFDGKSQQYFNDRIESLDDYYPCIQKENEGNLFRVYNLIQFFVSMYNYTIHQNYFIIELQERGELILNQHSP